jgi:DNA repair exonuclease SbcCD nuclease subunit
MPRRQSWSKAVNTINSFVWCRPRSSLTARSLRYRIRLLLQHWFGIILIVVMKRGVAAAWSSRLYQSLPCRVPRYATVAHSPITSWPASRTMALPFLQSTAATSNSIRTAASSSNQTGWAVGNAVVVTTLNQVGTIIEAKRGWYTVQLVASNEIIKARASNLQPHVEPTKKKRTVAAPRVEVVNNAPVVVTETAKTSAFSIGQVVLATTTSGPAVQGTIVKFNRGWYTIQMADFTETKCRAKDLQPVDQAAVIANPAAVAKPAKVAPTLPRSSPARATSVGLEPIKTPLEVPPPPPTLVDLDAAVAAWSSLDAPQSRQDQDYLRQVAHHASFRYWIVFTDLHCAPDTLDTTCQVLDLIQAEAQRRNAAAKDGTGVLFLGDWWHHRGSLRVDCLNAVLDRLAQWTVPLVMIPGNHDQITLGGTSHSLTPLQHAFRIVVDPAAASNTTTINGEPDSNVVSGPLIFSHPTKFAEALFVPHIRDHAFMESVLQSPLANDAAAIFVHADVTGASMNDLMVSSGGVPPTLFPPHKPIYSGHFHKPHVVTTAGGVHIEYLGSPYEVSLAEAQQAKALVVLDAHQGWQPVDRIPLAVGRRHYKVADLDQFLRLQPAAAHAEDFAGPMVRAGDRVVLSIAQQVLEQEQRRTNAATLQGDARKNAVDAHVDYLRQHGAMVEVREIKDEERLGRETMDRQEDMEDLSPPSLWKAYLQEELERGSLDQASFGEVESLGLRLLDEVNDETTSSGTTVNPVNDLKLSSVTVEGFGPFRDPVTYPLLDRGLVLLKGSNRDGGSDR